jgi:hypothetical protein
VYVADYANHKLRKISPLGEVITLAGSGYSGQTDGTGSNADLYYPMALALDSIGNVYFSEYSYGKIRKVTPAGEVTTVAGQAWNSGFQDGKSSNALFYNPTGVALDKSGFIYVADFGNNRIRKMTPAYYNITPGLPAGLKFDPLTGTISGKPTTTSSSTSYIVYTFNSGGECNTQVTISIAPVGLNDLESEVLTVYPNPASTRIQLSGLKGRELLTVYSLTGVKLLSQVVSNGEPIDISKLKSGLYMVKVGGKDLKLVKK